MPDIKLSLALLATVILLAAYIPYFRDIFRGDTKPHLYTWLVWAITQWTATAGVWAGGGHFAAIGVGAGALMVLFVFLLSFKYGTKNITRSDTFVLMLALFAVVLWWLLKDPLPSVLMVTAIDGLGYIPTWRKTYQEPWSETLGFWAAMAASIFLVIAASAQYNLLTVLYPLVLGACNVILFGIILIGRQAVSKPADT